MYLKQALEQSKQVESRGAGLYGIVFDIERDLKTKITLEQAISDQWSPVLPEVTLIEATKKWKRFRRRTWTNKEYYWGVFCGAIRTELYNDHIVLSVEHLTSTDWEEYTGRHPCD